MVDEPEDLDPAILSETLASCIEQLHHVRARVVLLDDGSPARACSDLTESAEIPIGLGM